MKICITAKGVDLDSEVDPRFGRAQYFIVLDTEREDFLKLIENPNQVTTGGAGINSSQLIAKEEVKVLLTGNVGPNAFETLSSFGIEVYNGAAGTIKEALKAYQEGKLVKTNNASVESHFGNKI